MKRWLSAAVVSALIVVACGKRESSSPSSPTRLYDGSTAHVAVAVSEPTASLLQAPAPAVTLPSSDWVSADIPFPPRNEPFAFRQQLETYYRDRLRRSANPTFVDIEGTIVWTQEYLRYRVNLCDHPTAVQKVFQQIDGLGVQPACGAEPPTAVFPPRNEPFAFRQQLETKYRDGLRRSAILSFVDTEGDIVWTQEYLRYRVVGCDHGTAQQFVIDQIEGRGVAAGCGTITENLAGTVSGGSPVCPDFFTTTRLPCDRYPFRPSSTGLLSAVLRWSDSRNFLELLLVRNTGLNSNDRVAISRDIFVTEQMISAQVNRGTNYEVRVLYDGGRTAQPYTLTVTRPQ